MPTLENLKQALSVASGNAQERAKNNERLRQRLESVKSQVSAEINFLMTNMLNMDPRDFLSDEEIDAHLQSAFNKFDEDGSGALGKWEFTQAWLFLGLKGTDEEISEAFDSVDKNQSGTIDAKEFKMAIKSERMIELNLRGVLEKMGVQMNNMGGSYESFKATEQRRRLMKKEYEENLGKRTREMIERLA